ncbi:hypothetical protein [Paraburkholderia sp. GAS334]|uniref:hypothetical protein n=1 Tax=Paraburkholderia sp. GAS334 TaxID=3035131 RepID=UPI003D2024E4
MVDDPAVQWRQATQWTIQIDAGNDYWETGRINDVAITFRGTLLVGADTGGVWSVAADGASALPLSDSWDNPDIRCVRLGQDGDDHVFAGGGGLHVTDPSAPVPLFAWHEIASVQKLKPGTIYSIALLRGPRRIVVACDAGLLWAEVPPAGPPPLGCLAALVGLGSNAAWKDEFKWKAAVDGDGTFNGAMFSVVVGSADREHQGSPEGLNGTTVVAGAKGSDSSRGLFVGEWNASGDLVMGRAHLTGANDLAQLTMASVSLDVCTSRPSRMYAACSDENGHLMTVLRSDDGGRLWDLCGTKLIGGTVGNLTKNAGEQGGDGWNNCVGVSPFDPELVAVGWQFGPFVSADGGATWYQAEGGNHADHHATIWDPRIAISVTGATGERLYVCSDGGIVSTDDRGKTFNGGYNKHIHVLQCYSGDAGRESWGSVGACGAMPNVFGAGTQDNGNIYALVGPSAGPFVRLDGADGGFNCFLPNGWVLHDIGLQSSPRPVLASRWDPGSQTFVDTRTPPIAVPKPGGKKDPGGLTGVYSLEPVQHPKFRRGREMLYSVAGVSDGRSGGDMYGLFIANDVTVMEWRYLGSVEGTPWSVASVDGTAIFVGTDHRRIFNLDPLNGAAVEYLYDASLNATGTILRIVAYSNDRAYAIQNWNSSGDIIALRGLVWSPARNGIPKAEGTFWGLTAARNIDNDTLIAVTDAHAWISYDEARSWQRASKGLPVRPHCADIRFGRNADGSQRLHLGTYGRSAWIADLLPDVEGQVGVPGTPGLHG